MASNTNVGTTQGGWTYQGPVYCSMVLPSQPCLTDSMFLANAGSPINGSRLQHENPGIATGIQLFGPSTTISALTQLLGLAWAGGTLLGFQCAIVVAGSGMTPVVTVDLQKSTGGGAFASVLGTPITLSQAANTNTPLTCYTATIATSAYLGDDIFQTVITATGGGTYPKGLIVNVLAKENPT